MKEGESAEESARLGASGQVTVSFLRLPCFHNVIFTTFEVDDIISDFHQLLLMISYPNHRAWLCIIFTNW